jgi:flagellar assembly protein FliH
MTATLLPSEWVGEITAHRIPAVIGPIIGDAHARTHDAPSPRDLARIRERAREEGYAQAYAERAAQLDQYAQRLQKICAQLSAPLEMVDVAVVESLAELAVSIARHLVRRELKHAPGEVIGVVREAMRQLPLAARRGRIHLHPEDAEIVQGALNLGPETAWELQPDPLISRGGCVVETEASRIDAQVESRIAAIASRMLGGEREGDRVR